MMNNKNKVCWYYTQQECYDTYRYPEHASYLFIARDSKLGGGKKEYTAFNTVDSYLKWLSTQENKNCYEQVRRDYNIEFYDIDEKTDSKYWTTNIKLFKDDPYKVLDDFFKTYQEWLQTTNYPHKDTFSIENALILQSSNSNEKISFHITMRHGFLFQDIKHTKIYIDNFVNFLKQHQKEDMIDSGIYTKNRCFRTIHCSKKDSSRILERCNYNRKSMTCKESDFFVTNIIPELNIASNQSCLSMLDECGKLNSLGYESNCYYLKLIKSEEEVHNKVIEDIDDDIPIDLEDLIHDTNLLISILDPNRNNNYSNWLNMGWVLFNISDGHSSFLDIWKKWSSSYKYYKENELIKIWERCTKRKIGIATLKYWCNQDNPNAFDNIKGQLKIQQVSKFFKIQNIPEKERTTEEKLHFNTIIKKILENNLNKLTQTSLIDSIKFNDDFVQSKTLLDSKKKIDVIKAGLGRGKSQSVSEYLSTIQKTPEKFDNIIVLTPRRSYAKSAKERLNRETGLDFICYLEQKKSLIDYPFVVIQAESLYRLQINTGRSIVIIDETEAFLSQLTSIQTHRENHVKNIETFIELIKNCNKCIALDAFISNRTLQTFITLSGLNHINFFEYTKQLKQRKATEIDTYDKFVSLLLSDLELGKKIFLFSSSNTKLLKTKLKVSKKPDKPDKIITALLPAIYEKYPNKTIIEFHSKHMTIELSNVNKDWKDADLIACTSTITVGCNFDIPNIFNKVYIYANASSKNLVRDIFQASWRIRHLIDEEMVYCLDTNHYGMNLCTNIKEINEKIEKKNELLLQLIAKEKLSYPIETPTFIKNLLCFNKLESNISIMNLEPLFERYLKLCNYEICKEIDMDSILEVEFDEFINNEIEYNDIPEITPSVCKALILKKKTIPLLELESLQVEKFHFQYQLLNKSKEIEEGLWKIYTNFGKGKFRNISIEKGFIEGTCSIQDIIEKESYSHLNSGLSLRFQIIREITDWIGLKNTSEYGYKLSKDKLDNIIKLFQNNREKIHIAFDMRDRTKDELDSKTTIALINKILDRWSFSTIKSDKKRIRIDGKKITSSEYFLTGKGNNEIDIQKELKPYTKKNTTDDLRLHPLLLHKDDLKIITNKELEDIRLNR